MTCPYYNLDGQFNPDVRDVNDTGAFDAMSDAVFYNALSFVISGNTTYAQQAVTQINTWFLDEDTAMNPNLNYGQIIRGPNNAGGTHTGILDLKCMAKVVSGILLLRGANSTDYTDEVDSGMAVWAGNQASWLQTAAIAVQESEQAK